MADSRRGIRLNEQSLEDARRIALAYRTTISGAVRIALAETSERLQFKLDIIHRDQYYWVIRNGGRLGAFVFSDGHDMNRAYSNPHGVDGYTVEIVRDKINRGGPICHSTMAAAQVVADMADGKGEYGRSET